MNGTIETKLSGRTLHLRYTMQALFEAAEHFGGEGKAMEALSKEGKEGFEAFRFWLVLLSRAGEKRRREDGEKMQEYLREADVTADMTPGEYLAAKQAVIDAINAGYRRQEDDPEQEVDLTLMEIEEKKERAGA